MEEYHYFVAHEFTTQERDDLREAIDRAFRGTGLNASYADVEFRSGEHILKKIEDRILATQFGIYDITNENPNVYLELGLAKGAGKTLYIICKKGTKIRADLQGLDRIEYESYKNLTDEIKKKIIKKELERVNEIKERVNEIKAQRKAYEKHTMPEEDVLKNNVKLYKAEGLRHKFGYDVDDKEAHSQKAWFADLSHPLKDHIIYGPYEELDEQGSYIAFFKIKIDNNQSIESVLFLDVVGGGGRMLYGIDFDKPFAYQLFGIRFNYPSKGKMEYRVYNPRIQKLKVWIDYVRLCKNYFFIMSSLPNKTRFLI